MPVCSHARAPRWHHDETGIVVWTDSLCEQCAHRFTMHFWLMYLNQAFN